MSEPNQLDQNEISSPRDILKPTPQTRILCELEGFEESLHRSKYINLKLLTALQNSLTREDLLGPPPDRPIPVPPKDRMRAPYIELTNYGVSWVMLDLERNGRTDVLNAIDDNGFAFDKLSKDPSVGGTEQSEDLIRKAVEGASDEFKKMQGKTVDPKHFLDTGIQKALENEKSEDVKGRLTQLLNNFFSTQINLMKMGNWWDEILNNARS